MKWNLPHLNFGFSTVIPPPLKLADIVVKCEIEIRPAPPSSLMNSGHRSELKVVLALLLIKQCRRGLKCIEVILKGNVNIFFVTKSKLPLTLLVWIHFCGGLYHPIKGSVGHFFRLIVLTIHHTHTLIYTNNLDQLLEFVPIYPENHREIERWCLAKRIFQVRYLVDINRSW